MPESKIQKWRNAKPSRIAYADVPDDTLMLKIYEKDYSDRPYNVFEEAFLKKYGVKNVFTSGGEKLDTSYLDREFTPTRLLKNLGRAVTTTGKGLTGFMQILGMESTGENWGRAIQDFENNVLNIEDPTFLDEVIQGFGSAATFFIPGVGFVKGASLLGASTRVAAAIGVSASSILEAAVEGGASFNESIDRGDSVKRAREKGTQAFGLNIPLALITNRWFFNPEMGKRIAQVFKGAANEGMQEYIQELISTFAQEDSVLQGLKELGTGETQKQALRSGSIGAIVGGGIGAGQGVYRTIKGRKKIDPKIKDFLTPLEAQRKFREAQERKTQPEITPVAPTQLQPEEKLTAKDIQEMPLASFAEILGVDETAASITKDAVTAELLDNETDDVIDKIEQQQDEAKASILAEGNESIRSEILDTKEEVSELARIESEGTSSIGVSDIIDKGEVFPTIESQKELDKKSGKVKDIPIFSKTRTKSVVAFEFGLANKGNKQLEAELQKTVDSLTEQIEEVKKEPLSDEVFNRRNQLATESQLNKEAIDGINEGELSQQHLEQTSFNDRNTGRAEVGLSPLKKTEKPVHVETKSKPNPDNIETDLELLPHDLDYAQEPKLSAGNVVNSLVNDGSISTIDTETVIIDIRKLASENNTAAEFVVAFRKQYPNSTITDEELYSTFRTEQELESMDVVDFDVVYEDGKIIDTYVSDSYFVDHNGNQLGDRYLINSVLKPFKNKLAILNGYFSSQWEDLTDKQSPYKRDDTVNSANMTSQQSWEILEGKLRGKGYTLLPVSDSNTFMLLKLDFSDPKYKRRSNESQSQHRARLSKKLSERYPEHSDYWNGLVPRDLMTELQFDDFMIEAFGKWYSGDIASKDLAKRFKMFLPKGEPLEFTRDINAQIAEDFVYKDKNGKPFIRKDTSELLSTDGTLLINPKFAKEFFPYNKLGNVHQEKSFTTESSENHLLGFKYLAHVATPQEWSKVSNLAETIPNSDMIVFRSSAKIARDVDGKDIESGQTFKIKPSSIRHITSGKQHDRTTLTRQIFNFISNPKVMESIKTRIIDRIAGDVKRAYRDYEKQPELLLKKVQEIINDDKFDVSDVRRYFKSGAVFYKTLRNKIRGYLTNELIAERFVKLQHDGNFSYFRPDFFNEYQPGEVALPFSELKKIAAQLNIELSPGQDENARNKINNMLSDIDFEVLTFRPPVSRSDNIQVLKVRKILSKDYGNSVIMNARDAILNKEGDYDGDVVFYHYPTEENGFNEIVKEVKSNEKPVTEIYIQENPSGFGVRSDARIRSALAAGLSKVAIGQIAKAMTVRRILEVSNAKIIELEDGSFSLVGPEYNAKVAINVYELKDNLSDWDSKITITAQAAVDNLRLNALTKSDNWVVDKETGNVDFNRRQIYKDLFEGDIDANSVDEALTILNNALNVFTTDFETGGKWNQERINKTLRVYFNKLRFSGGLGTSLQERMMFQMKDMGYMNDGKENYYNSLHDNAHKDAYKEFNKTYIEGGLPNNLPGKKKNEIEERILQLYKDKKLAEKDGVVSDIYTSLYDPYIEYANNLTDIERDYWDYLAVRGFTLHPNGNLAKKENARFILSVISDVNLKRFSEIFNKHYSKAVAKGNAPLLAMIGPYIEEPTIKNSAFSNAMYKIFGDYYVNLKFPNKDKIPFAESLQEIDAINRELDELGRLPFSDKVDIEELYRATLIKRGKTLADPLDRYDGVAILVNIKQLKLNLATGRINNIKQYFYFTEDLFIKNPYTQKHVKELSSASNEKDSQSEHFVKKISNRAGKGLQGVRELLDLSKDTKKSKAMHSALKVLDMRNKLNYYELTNQDKKYKKLNREINETLINKDIAEQVDAIEDVILALDGQLSNDFDKNFKYLEKRWNSNVAQSYSTARKLLDEILEFDIETYDKHIGDPKQKGTWQYERMQTLRKKLRDAQWDNTKIENAIRLLTIKKPGRWENYYPHVYLMGIESSQQDQEGIGGKYNLLNQLEQISANDLSDRVKTIKYWKKREHETQELHRMADRNLITVLSRRVDSSVNVRWANRFRRIYNQMVISINEGIKREIKKGNTKEVEKNIKTLEDLRGIADSMYNDVAIPADFGYWRSMANIMRGLLLSNLLLFSSKGTLRNVSQGIVPNIINFGAGIFRKGWVFSRAHGGETAEIVNEDGTSITIGGNGGDVILKGDKLKNIFNDMGIGRSDIFAKIEGGQEWDAYRTMEKVQDFNIAIDNGEISLKAKNYTKDFLTNLESRMNKYTKIVGENNIFTFMYGGTKRGFAGAWNKIVAPKHRIPLPEIKPTTKSFSGAEYWNRRMTASMAFQDRWSTLRESGAELNEVAYKDAIRYAQDMVDKIQFNYNMWNKPGALRKFPGVFQFKSFTLGLIKLHSVWLTGSYVDTRKNINKLFYFALMGAIVTGLEKWTSLGFWRFFELPEQEYAKGFRDLFFGNRTERKWAFYGNRLSPVAGPAAGLMHEALIASRITGENKVRRNLAWYRMIESTVPLTKELNEIYKRSVAATSGSVDVGDQALQYLGFYPVYYDLKRKQITSGKKKEKYEGPIREMIKRPKYLNPFDPKLQKYFIPKKDI